jgi:hypothetical protein
MAAKPVSITVEQARAALDKHGNKSAAARALGIHRDTMAKLIGGKYIPAPVPARAATRRTIQSFREQFDKDTIVPRKIQDFLSSMSDDGDLWIPESELRERAHISATTLNLYREQFAGQIVAVDRKNIWCVNKGVANQIRKMKLL